MNFTNHIATCFFYFFLFPVILSSFNYVDAQETNGHVSGRVLSEKNEIISHANVTVLHEPTQSKYVAVTRHDGYFHFFNIKPGGPYKINQSLFPISIANNFFLQQILNLLISFLKIK